MPTFIVAIDGPSGVGKGTVARAVARTLGFRYIDTGAMYRAIAWKAVRDQVPLDDEAAIATVAERAEVRLEGDRTSVDGQDITAAIRTGEIDSAAAAVARLPRVREALVGRQRAMAGEGGLVMEGRDIGTVVFPGADVKVYLDAAPEERARRRAADRTHAHANRHVAEVATALEARDALDRTREVSPLSRASDAHLIDTTSVPADEVAERVLELVKDKLRERGI